jgi:hypothetical protein
MDWDDGHSTSIQRNDMARVEKVSEFASARLEPKPKSVRQVGDGLVA